MRLIPLASSVLAFSLLVGCVHAAPTAVERSTTRTAARSDAGLRAGVVELRKRRFKKLDLNADGAVTRNEATDEALRHPGIIETFSDYDRNGDGRIVLDEFLHDGVIRWWMAELRPRMRTMFSRADADGDGRIAGDELASIRLFFSLFPETHGGDLNQDGAIPFSEFEDAYMIVLPKLQPQAPERAGLERLG